MSDKSSVAEHVDREQPEGISNLSVLSADPKLDSKSSSTLSFVHLLFHFKKTAPTLTLRSSSEKLRRRNSNSKATRNNFC